MTVAKATVFVVDDDPIICDSLKQLIASVGLQSNTFLSARSFLETTIPEQPCCLVLDIRMPDLSGLDLQAELTRRNVSIPIIFITGHGTVSTCVKAMKAGAVDFFEKPLEEQALLDSIQYALKRHNRIQVEKHTIDEIEKRIQSLTSREQEVLLFVTAGIRNMQIATKLEMSVNTVKTHRARIMRKMKAKSLADLVKITEKTAFSTSKRN